MSNGDPPHPQRRKEDGLEGRVKRASGWGLVTGLSLLTGAFLGITKVAQYSPWETRDDIDHVMAVQKDHLKIPAHAGAAQSIELLKTRLDLQVKVLTDGQKELKEDFRELRVEIRQAIREARDRR